MKKSLLAVAVAAALPAAAFAQSNVTLYGLIDVGYSAKSWKNNGGTTNSKSSGIQDGAGGPNRFGLRGVEDLGGGLKAEFVMEHGISATSQRLTNERTVNSGHQVDAASVATDGGRSTDSINRQTYVGLSGGFGTLRGGYQLTNAYMATSVGGFVYCSEGNEGCDVHVAAPYGGVRANGLTYISPRMGGLTLTLQYGAGTDLNTYYTSTANNDLKQTRMSVMGNYDAGPLRVVLAHTSYKAGSAVTVGAVAPATTDAKLTQLGATYDLKVAQLGLNWLAANNGGTGAGERDTKGWQLSTSVPMGPALSLKAGIGNVKTENGSGTEVVDARSWQVGAAYAMSKRTTAYFYYGTRKDSAVAAGALEQKTQTTVGVMHVY